jgi:hypothetical protein
MFDYAVQPFSRVYRKGSVRRKAIRVGTWDWNDVENKVVPLDAAPPPAKMAAAIISDERFDEDWERKVFALTGLPQISLVEWHVCSEVESIFGILRDAGSQRGWVVESGGGHAAQEYAREIELSASRAEQIHRDLAMEFPMAFVDDQQLCVLVSLYSDYALICLHEDLFQKWLATNPVDLTLFAHEPYPVASDLKTAQTLARRRSTSWHAQVRETSSP